MTDTHTDREHTQAADTAPPLSLRSAAIRWADADRAELAATLAAQAAISQPRPIWDRADQALQDACAAEREALEQLKAAARAQPVEPPGVPLRAAADILRIAELEAERNVVAYQRDVARSRVEALAWADAPPVTQAVPSAVDALSHAQYRRAVLALRDLTTGGEFAAWMHGAGPELPLAANREYDEAVALMRDMVGAARSDCVGRTAAAPVDVRADAMELALRALVRRVRRIGGHAEPHEQEALWAAERLLGQATPAETRSSEPAERAP